MKDLTMPGPSRAAEKDKQIDHVRRDESENTNGRVYKLIPYERRKHKNAIRKT